MSIGNDAGLLKGVPVPVATVVTLMGRGQGIGAQDVELFG